jgi:hypothetical protein
MSMDDETAKRRLLLYSLARFAGLAIFFLGIAIIYSNLARPGGSPQLGAVVAILGVLASFFAPRLLKKRWDAAAVDRPLDDRTDARDRRNP